MLFKCLFQERQVGLRVADAADDVQERHEALDRIAAPQPHVAPDRLHRQVRVDEPRQVERRVGVDPARRREGQRRAQLAEPHRRDVRPIERADAAHERDPEVAQDVEDRKRQEHERVRVGLALMGDEPRERREGHHVEDLVHQRVGHLAEGRDDVPLAGEPPVEHVGHSREEHQGARDPGKPEAARELLHDGKDQPREDQRHARESQRVDE